MWKIVDGYDGYEVNELELLGTDVHARLSLKEVAPLQIDRTLIYGRTA